MDQNRKKSPEAEAALVWEEVRTEHLVRDRWIDFRKSAYRLPDGSVQEPYYTYSRRSYAVIVASDEEGRFLCVRQFRYGIGKVTIEFPAGGIDCDGDAEYTAPDALMAKSEDPLTAAKRELLEETGCESDDWEHLLSVPSNATIADNYAHIFRARNCRKVSDQHLDESEFLEVEHLTAQEIEDLIKRENFLQAMHILAYMLARQADARKGQKD